MKLVTQGLYVLETLIFISLIYQSINQMIKKELTCRKKTYYIGPILLVHHHNLFHPLRNKNLEA